MEDAATAEISRAQLWQWRRLGAKMDDERTVTREVYCLIREEELSSLGGENIEFYALAAKLLDELVLSEEFIDFLTLPAYEILMKESSA